MRVSTITAQFILLVAIGGCAAPSGGSSTQSVEAAQAARRPAACIGAEPDLNEQNLPLRAPLMTLPASCAAATGSRIAVVTYDVGTDGRVAAVTKVDATEACLAKEAVETVLQYRYRQKLVDGAPAPRCDFSAVFDLSDEGRLGEQSRQVDRRAYRGGF